jgi:hypothetical protein
MRLSDLLGCAVHDGDGNHLGTVIDVRLAQIGRIKGPMAELIVESLLVPRARPDRCSAMNGDPSKGRGWCGPSCGGSTAAGS